MKLAKKTTSLIVISIIGVALISTTATILVAGADDITITFLPSDLSDYTYGSEEEWMSSILIVYKGIRIYIDPFNIDENSEKADAIFITHPHEDHWDQDTIDFLAQDSTEFVGPTSCAAFIAKNNATGVVPGDNGTIAGISFTAIRAYNPQHPVENNWCGYIFTIEEYTILIPGDTSDIAEYIPLRDTIDVLIYPVGDTCSNPVPHVAIDVISIIRPTYFIPIHYGVTQELSRFTDIVPLLAPGLAIYEQELFLK